MCLELEDHETQIPETWHGNLGDPNDVHFGIILFQKRINFSSLKIVQPVVPSLVIKASLTFFKDVPLQY